MSSHAAVSVPSSVQAFFAGSGGVNILASPMFLKTHTGKDRVFLPEHDIYHSGKDKTGGTVFTIYRILAKEYRDNTIQGMLRVSLIGGYGVNEENRSLPMYMRPNELKKVMTEGTTSIKRSSVVVFETGMVVRLSDIEIFCDLPLISKKELIERQSAGAVCKRDHYKATRGEDNWAHVKQGALVREMEASVHQLLLPYYRRYRDDEADPDLFFRAFLEDMVRTCTAHHKNFTDSGDFDLMLTGIITNNKKRSLPSLQTEMRPRKKWGGRSGEAELDSGLGQQSTPVTHAPALSRAFLGSKGSKGSKGTTTGTAGCEAGTVSKPFEAMPRPLKKDVVKEALRHVSRERMLSIIF